jgi:hypothetical protein
VAALAGTATAPRALHLKGFRVIGDPPAEIRCERCMKRWPLEDEAPTADQLRDIANHHKRRVRGKMAANGWRA